MIRVNKDRNNKGFTLVELLAVIAILSLVVTIIIYTATGIIDEAKDKSYKVTINNIQNEANNYVLEELSAKKWAYTGINSSYQYRCVTVNELIDSGYFDSNILKSEIAKGKLVDRNDLIYLERDKDTKAITRNVMLTDSRYDSLCSSYSSDGNIHYEVFPDSWSKEKTVKIYYNLDILDLNTIKDFKYRYFSVDNIILPGYSASDEDEFDNLQEMYEIKVNKNGQINTLMFNTKTNKILANSIINISGIDNEAPSGTISSTNSAGFSQDVTLSLDDTDVGSGILKYYFGRINSCNSVSESSWKILQNTPKQYFDHPVVSESGTYLLCAKDVVGNLYETSKTFHKTSFSISNVDEVPSYVITMDGNSFDLPSVNVSDGYEFDGWYEKSDFSGSSITSYKPTSDKLLYGKTIPNTYTIKYDLNGGSGEIDDGKKIHGTNFILSSIIPKRDGYTFDGWNTMSDGNGQKYSAGGYYISNKDVTLYAQWEKNTVTIKYAVNGGNINSIAGNYNWSIDSNGVIKRNNSVEIYTVENGGTLSSNGLADWDNINYINVIKPGYNAVTGSEWKCLSGNCNRDTYSDEISYSSDDFCDTTNGDCEVKLGVNWNINKVTIRYSVNGGNITPSTIDKNGITNNWTVDNGFIYKNGVLEESTINYGSRFGEYGLNNWSNSNYIQVSKTGFDVITGSEWKCLSDNCDGKIYNQWSLYTASDFCDATNKDCTVTLGVNWVSTKAPTLTITNPYRWDLTPSWYNYEEYKAGKKYILTLNAVDYSGLGIDYYAYMTDDDGIWQKYTNSTCINGSTECITSPWEKERNNEKVWLKVCDKAGNCTVEATWIKLDITPPTIHCNNEKVLITDFVYSTKETHILELKPSSSNACLATDGIFVNEGGEVMPNYQDNLYATDSFGIKENIYSYQIYNEEGYLDAENDFVNWWEFDADFCDWKWKLIAIDVAGNRAEGYFTYKVKY